MAIDSARAKSLFLAASDLADADERAAYLNRECGGDLELRERVERLLRADDASPLPELDPTDATGAFRKRGHARPEDVVDPAVSINSVIADKYKLVEEIGEGGMGHVYMAQQTEPIKRLVALKLIKPGMDSRQVLARFDAERQALALMDHPNIAKVHDAGTTTDGRPYFVMELVKGISITRFCDERRMTPRQRLELFVPVCLAIQHAHQKGVIHRDIKPSNVLVALYDDKPVPKVIDFGVAKATGQQLSEASLHTGFGAVVGTVEYMSPEQASFNQLDVDTRSDIYSLGVLLYELLAGSPPFSRKELEQAGVLEMLRVIREQEPSKPSTKLSTADGLPTLAANRGTEPAQLTKLVRGELDWIVMQALEKDRNRRYASANGLATDLQRYLADEPVSAGPPSATYRLRKFVRRNKGPVVAVSAILLLLVAGIISTSAGLIWAVRERDDKAKALLAETKAREAERQARNAALAALRAMTDEIVENQMARGTNLTEENKEFLRKIVKQFDGFAAVTADDAESRAIRAEGQFRVGLMRSRLGEPTEAETAHVASLALRKQLAADFPDHPEFRYDLSRSLASLGRLFNATGRLNEADTSYAEAMALQQKLVTEFPARPEFRQDLARSHSDVGGLHFSKNKLQEAESAFADALALRKQLVVDYPDRAEFREELAQIHHNLGVLYRANGQLAKSEAAANNAIALQKKLVSDFPTRPEYRRSLALGYNGLGNLLSTTEKRKEAEAAHADALTIRKQLAADFPTRPEFRQDLALSHHNLGNLFYRTGRPKDAEAAYGAALALRKQLAADFPTRPDFRHELAMSHNSMGAVLSDTEDRLKEAEAAYAEALALFEQLAAEFPTQPDRRNAVAGACVNLALLRVQQKDFAKAKADVERAAPHHEALLKSNQRNPTYRQFYRNNLRAMIQVHAGLGDPASAKQTAQYLRDLGLDPPTDAYEAACGLALCISIVRNDDRSPNEARDQQAADFGDEAMTMLRDAVAKGYANAYYLNKDNALNSLREREDFKQLLAELKK